MNYKQKMNEVIMKTNGKKEELLWQIIAIIDVLPMYECQRIYDYLSELYFS